MSYSEADILTKIASLESDLLRSEQQVAFGGRSVTYVNRQSTLQSLAYFKTLLTQVRGRSRQYVPVVNRGLNRGLC